MTYAAAQIEPFDSEYDENHRSAGPDSLSSTQTSWESLDKDEAPLPHVFDAEIRLVIVLHLSLPAFADLPLPVQVRAIRDKSPPPSPLADQQ